MKDIKGELVLGFQYYVTVNCNILLALSETPELVSRKQRDEVRV